MSGLGNIAGALSGLAQGFIQGRELRDQEQLQQQQLQQQKLGNASGLLDIYRTLAQSGALPNTPQSVQSVNAGIAPLGITLDQQSIGNLGTIPESQLLPYIPQLQALDPNMRSLFRNIAPNLGDEFWTAPARPTPQDAERQYNDLRLAYQPYIMGWADPNSADAQQIRAQMQALQQYMPGYVGAPAGTNPSAPPAPGSRLTATVNNLNSTAGANQSRSNYYNSLSALTQKKGQWYDKVEQATIDKMHAQTGLSLAEMAAVPQRIAQGWIRTNAEAQRAQDLHQQYVVNMTQLQGEIKKNGFTDTAMAHYTQAMNSLQNGVTQDRIAADAAHKQVLALLMMNNNQPPPPDSPNYKIYQAAVNEETQATNRYHEGLKTLGGLRQGQTQMLKRVYQGKGGPNSWNPVQVPPRGKPVATLHGKPIFVNPSGNGYVYADGSPAK